MGVKGAIHMLFTAFYTVDDMLIAIHIVDIRGGK
jgi:hypothetical protein